MKIKITFNAPAGAPPDVIKQVLNKPITLDCDHWEIDPRHGWLRVIQIRDGTVRVIGEYAPGVIRCCVNVGEFAAALVPDENSRERAQAVG